MAVGHFPHQSPLARLRERGGGGVSRSTASRCRSRRALQGAPWTGGEGTIPMAPNHHYRDSRSRSPVPPGPRKSKPAEPSLPDKAPLAYPDPALAPSLAACCSSLSNGTYISGLLVLVSTRIFVASAQICCIVSTSR